MRRLLPFLAVMVLAACDPDGEDPVITDVDDPPVGSFAANVAGLPPATDVRGAVEVTSFVPYFIAQASLTGLTPGTAYQWKTYFGNCASPDVQLGPTANPPAYPEIVADASGAGAATATVAGRLRTDSIYSVRVYTIPTLSPAPADTTFVACGDFTKK